MERLALGVGRVVGLFVKGLTAFGWQAFLLELIGTGTVIWALELPVTARFGKSSWEGIDDGGQLAVLSVLLVSGMWFTFSSLGSGTVSSRCSEPLS